MSSPIVSNTNDAGLGSLRDAIDFANLNPGTTITFTSGAFGAINILTALANITANNTTINGPGSSITSVNRTGAGSYRIFTIGAGITVNINGLSVSGGTSTNGGGILLGNGSTGTFTDLNLTSNTATSGAGLFVSTNSFCTYNNSVISACNSTVEGGGIHTTNGATCNLNNMIITNNNAQYGAGIYVNNTTTCNISNTVISNNNGVVSGGIYNSGTLTITSSTISANTNAPTSTVWAAGILNLRNITIQYCTIDNNVTSTPIDIGANNLLSISLDVPSTALISNSTFTNGQANGVLSIQNYQNTALNIATITFVNVTVHNSNNNETILNGGQNPNTGTINIGNTVYDIFTNNGIFNNNGGNWNVGAPLNNGDPQLQNILQNNGGPTLTLSPLSATSPLVDSTGNNALVLPGVTDQRGYIRIINAIVDIGAVEFDSVPVCYSGKSLILTKNIITGEITETKAQDVLANVHEVFDTKTRQFIPIKYNIVTGFVNRFMLIKRFAW